MKICIVHDCNKNHRSKGYCNKHYQRFLKYGDPLFTKMDRETCLFKNCTKLRFKQSLCDQHFKNCYNIEKDFNQCHFDGCNISSTLKSIFCIKHVAKVTITDHGVNYTKAPNNSGLSFLINNKNADHNDCIIWPYCTVRGYGYLNYNGVNMYASRAMCYMAYGEPLNSSMYACHNCHNPSCVNPNHLRWDTPSNNQIDRIENNTDSRGHKHANAKFTKEQVLSMREISLNCNIRDIANMDIFPDVNLAVFVDAIRGNTYKNLPNANPKCLI